MNNAVSAAVGFIPIVGDVVLAAFKANSRNAALLEEFLRIRGEEFLKRENERVENPENVRPGAGREVGEIVSGKDSGTGNSTVARESSGGWFRRLSKGKDSSKFSTPAGSDTPMRRESRFIEDVPEGTGKAKK